MRTSMAYAGTARHAQRRPRTEARPARCKAMFAELSDYLDEQLDDSLCEELERHFEDCAPCRVFLASLAATIEHCKALPADGPDRNKALDLCRQLVSHYQQTMARNSDQPATRE